MPEARIPRRIPGVFRLGLWGYLVLFVALGAVVDRDILSTRRLNWLKQFEAPLRDFAWGGPRPGPDDLKWALRYYERLARALPSDGAVWGDIAFCRYYLGDHEGASAAYGRGIGLEPELASLYWDRGMAAYGLGKPGEARPWLERYLVRRKAQSRYFKAVRGRLEHLGRRDLVPMVDLLLDRMREDDRKAYVVLSRILIDGGEALQAMAVAGRGLGEDAGNQRLYYYLAEAALQAGEPARALAALDQALRLRPDDLRAYALRAAILGRVGRDEAAREDLGRAASLKRLGVVPLTEGDGTFRLHLYTELLVLRYQVR